MTLPPFSGLDSSCPKCGTRGLAAKYIAIGATASYGSLAYRAADDCFPCVERTCKTCGFQALEAPLSASDALTPPPPPSQTKAKDADFDMSILAQ